MCLVYLAVSAHSPTQLDLEILESYGCHVWQKMRYHQFQFYLPVSTCKAIGLRRVPPSWGRLPPQRNTLIKLISLLIIIIFWKWIVWSCIFLRVQIIEICRKIASSSAIWWKAVSSTLLSAIRARRRLARRSWWGFGYGLRCCRLAVRFFLCRYLIGVRLRSAFPYSWHHVYF